MTTSSQERDDLIETLQAHRDFLRFTARDLTEEQARLTPTVSALSIGGLIKHVTRMEERWVVFIQAGPSAMAMNEDSFTAHQASFVMSDDESLADLLATYDEVARATDALVASIDSLDESQPLPEAPWFKPGARRSARRVFMHIIAETSQHAGHADIIREAIDGQKTMG